MNTDDINDYLPSILNPRGVRKQNGEHTLTQNSIVSRCSLSLRRKNGYSCVKNVLYKTYPQGKENERNNNVLECGTESQQNVARKDIFQGARVDAAKSRSVFSPGKANSRKTQNLPNCDINGDFDEDSLGLSVIEGLNKEGDDRNNESRSFSFGELVPLSNNVSVENNDECIIEILNKEDKEKENNKSRSSDLGKLLPQINNIDVGNKEEFVITLSSATELNEGNLLDNSKSTIIYEETEKPVISVSFGVMNCKTVNISTNSGNIKKINLNCKDNNNMDIDCDVIESSQISTLSEQEESNNDLGQPPPKKSAVAVNLEIKKTTLAGNAIEQSKVLILNTDAIERLSHVIVQPPNYRLVKRQISDRIKFKNNGKRKLEFGRNGKTVPGDKLKQRKIDSFFRKKGLLGSADRSEDVVLVSDGDEDMSKVLGVADAVKCDQSGRAGRAGGARREPPPSPRRPRRAGDSPRPAHPRAPPLEAQRPFRLRNDSTSSAPSPRKNAESVQFTLPPKTASNKNAIFPKNIPYHKIVAGTHFAVDAFSYGDIPNVKHYFLTHFHSDHYAGLKKGFNKLLFCSKITADLCTTRLGVNPKCIHVINFDETITVEGVEVTAVDANHCPGALMLVFTLPDGKSLLHTGDFRAAPHMESYPVFWNKDIHTIYLDSTYCNPRYDFPTQDQSLEMALYHLRQKKLELEKANKKFSSVLIVCGTYTIGKEKFFLGMSRRVGCSVWACPEKDKVLRAVEGRGPAPAAPAACQLHVVPMRDLTHEKLSSYLDSLQGAFSEVVAFKPSGWENGKNSAAVRDRVTIHGIPYSEHSSFSEMIRFVKFLRPKQVVPTVDISGGVKAVQKYFPCPLVCKEESHSQSKVTDYYSIQNRQQMSSAVT